MQQGLRIKAVFFVGLIATLFTVFYLFSRNTLLNQEGGIFTGGAVQASANNQVIVKPSADTFIRERYSTKNYEGANEIVSDGDPRVTSLLRYDISNVDFSKVTKVELSVKPTISRKINKKIRLVTSNWDSTNVTWKTAPSLGNTIGSIDGEVKEGVVRAYALDLNQIKAAGRTVNIAIEDQSRGNSLTFSSAETNNPGAILVFTMSQPVTSSKSSTATPTTSKPSSSSSVSSIASSTISSSVSSSTSSKTSSISSISSSVSSVPTTPVQPGNSVGFWITPAEIKALPTDNDEWKEVYSVASRSWGEANIAFQDSNHDNYVMAGAIVCVRTGEFCDKTKSAIYSAIGTEGNTRWLNVGRNLLGYIIASDILGIRPDGNNNSDNTRIYNWLAGFLTKYLPDNNTGVPERLIPFESGSNASAQEASVYTALAAYTNDRGKLEYAWNRFRLYSCDKTSPETVIDIKAGIKDGWAHDEQSPCAVVPKGAVKAYNGTNYRIDGAVINDIRRGGPFKWKPGYTQYPWIGLEGYVPTALILSRQGYKAFDLSEQSIARVYDYLWFLKEQTGDQRWFDGKRADETTHIVNMYYGTNYPVESTIGVGRTFGFTGFTHSKKESLSR